LFLAYLIPLIGSVVGFGVGTGVIGGGVFPPPPPPLHADGFVGL